MPERRVKARPIEANERRLAQALGHWAVRQGVDVVLTSCAALTQGLNAARAIGRVLEGPLGDRTGRRLGLGDGDPNQVEVVSAAPWPTLNTETTSASRCDWPFMLSAAAAACSTSAAFCCVT